MRLVGDKVRLAPTDLSNYLGCRHLSGLDLGAARGALKRPELRSAFRDALKERGITHEKAYLASLEARGLKIRGSADGHLSIADTLAAMGQGVDVIYQGTLADDDWLGHPDFLVRVEAPSGFGDWSYEVVETKLARDTRAGTLLQLCVYSFLLSRAQDAAPADMRVVSPGDPFNELRYRATDFGAYFRLLEKGIGGFIHAPVDTYPDLVPQCELCVWWNRCEARRRGDDHLCYVAGIAKGQIKMLHEMGIRSLGQLADTDDIPNPRRGTLDALLRVREQARVQRMGRESGRPYFEIKQPFDGDHGFAQLPEPTPDDIFLDFEGNHFADRGAQEYLTGYVTRNRDGGFVYNALWAITQAQEKAAFERFMDFATDTLLENPRAHIYHFAPYEPAALKRLMGRFATRESALDQLLRGNAFMDLHAIVRRSLLAGVEQYSLKNLEAFFGFERSQDLREATVNRYLLEAAIEDGEWDEGLVAAKAIVQEYNREDCVATAGLQDWLERLRADALAQGHDIPRPVFEVDRASDKISALDAKLQDLRQALLSGVPADPEQRSDEDTTRFVLAHMMEFHRREDKAVWWEYFRVLDLDLEDYRNERRAVIGLEFHEVLKPGRAPLERYRFSEQDIDARAGDELFDREGEKIGSVESVSFFDRTIDIKKTIKKAKHRPDHAVFFKRVSAEALQQALIRLGEFVLANGLAAGAPYAAALNLLTRRTPDIGSGGETLQEMGETPLQAACRLAHKLDADVLAIQGPPGTGKTYTGAEIIRGLIQAGKKVGVTAVSHKVIVNLLEEAMKAADKHGVSIRCVHKQKGKYSGNHAIEYENKADQIMTRLTCNEVDLVGGTAWLWAQPMLEQSVDVLIVDEAGQMALSNVLATAGAGGSLILLGDPQQLEQPLQSSHPEGSDVSALYHLLDGEQTMPPHRGLFLDQTRRLHRDICEFTSEVYYAGLLTPMPGLERQAIIGAPRFSGAGLRYVPVPHEGNQARAAEEVDAIEKIVGELNAGDVTWRDADNKEHRVGVNQILIVAPYNAQVAALSERLPKFAKRIGTVDRFQGQEAPVVIYSMTSSSPEDAPRGMDFLYDPHRFNVATSRARALCILVGAPALFGPECKSPKQMKMANGFCRYREMATEIHLDP